MPAQTVAVIGGTGPLGKGLSYRFASAGHTVTLGSRDPDRAAIAAHEINSRVGDAGSVLAAENLAAADSAEVVLVAVPYKGHRSVVESLVPRLPGKIVISCVNPLGFDKQGPYGLQPPEGSAAEEAQRLMPDAMVVGAFHHLAAAKLWSPNGALHDEDVLVCGDDAAAKDVVIDLAAAVTGHPGVDAGPLRLARQLEPLTAVLISINQQYKVRSGIRLTGLPDGG